MARGRIASPEEEEEEHDQQEEPSRKKQRTANGKKSSKAADDDANGSDSDGVVSEDEEATAAALRGWTIETFTDKPVQATKPVLQQVSAVYWRCVNDVLADRNDSAAQEITGGVPITDQNHGELYQQDTRCRLRA